MKKLANPFLPKNLEEAIKLAEIIANSDLAPKDYKGRPGNCLIAMQMGAELGLAPMQSIQNISVINGRPAVWGDAMLALVRNSGLMEWIKEELHEDRAVCTVKRVGEEPATRVFTLEDAKRAGLLGKQGTWQQYPKRMLQMRARSWALRDMFADVLKGLVMVEEVMDIPEEKEVNGTAERVAQKLEQKEPEIRIDDLLMEIASAQTVEELRRVAAKAKMLPSEVDKMRARECYRHAMELIKEKELDKKAQEARNIIASHAQTAQESVPLPMTGTADENSSAWNKKHLDRASHYSLPETATPSVPELETGNTGK